MNKKICGYVRVSTQRQKEEGVSIETQQRMILDYALRFEIISKKEDMYFFIDDGYSGKSLNRPSMQKLIDLIKKGDVSILLSYDLSRISRDLFDSNLLFNLIKKYDVLLKCLYEDIKTDTAGDRFTTNIKVLNNQYERERIIERTNDGLKSIAESGRYPIGGKIFFGYYRGKDKNIYIHPTNSKLVLKAIEMGKNGYNIHYIREYLNNHQNELHFTIDMVKKIFNDIRYTGVLKYKGKIYNNIIPSITTSEDLEIASKNYKKTKYKQNNKYYFDGLVYCSSCGSKLSCTHSYGKKQIYYYYKCSVCNGIIGQHHIEEYLYKRTYKNNINIEYIKDLKNQRKALKKRFKIYQDKFINNLISDKEYCFICMPIEEKINYLEQLIATQKEQNTTINYAMCNSNLEKKNFALTYFNQIKVCVKEKCVIEVLLR